MPSLYNPNPELQKNTVINSMDKYYQLWQHANENPEEYWGALAKEKITWKQDYSEVLNINKAPFYSWFNGGKLNVVDQCVDRHLEKNSQKTAIIWESESKEIRNISYQELSISVNKFANLLSEDLKIKKGDRVVIYMPMIPEAIFAMLACAKIGAIHVVVFGGFSAEVLRERILDTDASLIITADGAYRRGKTYTLKPIVDKAIDESTEEIQAKVLVIKHNNEKITTYERDYDYNQLIHKKEITHESELMDSEDTLFILHTSGSTGKPKGIKHTTAGYILWAQYTSEIVFNLKKDDIFWCTADIGWVTGHTYGIYGPLAIGTTILMYEGVPTHPDNGRWWDIIERHRVTQFYTAPTAIRMLHKSGPEDPSKYDLSSLKILGTVGEPIDPTAWDWYYNSVGGGHCPIVDTWWQTETGGHIIAPLPGATPIKPGSATLPLPGVNVEILNAKGEKVTQGEHGFLCITKPWPSMFRSIWQDDNKYINSYFDIIKSDDKHIYFSGDGAYYDEDGYITITGRTDDVMNISGHRISNVEVESVIATHPKVAEVAIVSQLDNISGESIVAYVTLNNDYISNNKFELLDELNDNLAKSIGRIIKIQKIFIVPSLPKTRSGKVLRRSLRSIARHEQVLQDFSTIENPEIIKIIQDIVNTSP